MIQPTQFASPPVPTFRKIRVASAKLYHKNSGFPGGSTILHFSFIASFNGMFFFFSFYASCDISTRKLIAFIFPLLLHFWQLE